MYQYKYIIFDLDGTLFDTSPGIIKAFDETVQYLGYPMLAEDKKNSVIGPPVYQSFQREYGMSSQEAMQATQYFRDLYKDQYLGEYRIYEGMQQLLSSLKEAGYRLGVATYKREDCAKELILASEIGLYFDSIRGSDYESKLTKKDIMELCFEELSCPSEPMTDAIMVGDTVHDALAAKELGMDFIAVTYGFGFKNARDAENFQPISVVNDVSHIINTF